MEPADLARNSKKSKKAQERRAAKKAQRSRDQALANYIDHGEKRKHNEIDNTTTRALVGETDRAGTSELAIKKRKIHDSILSSPQASRDLTNEPHESPRLYNSKAEKKAARKAARAAAREREQNSSELTPGLAHSANGSTSLMCAASKAAPHSATRTMHSPAVKESSTIDGKSRDPTHERPSIAEPIAPTPVVAPSASLIGKRKKTKQKDNKAEETVKDAAQAEFPASPILPPLVNNASIDVADTELVSDHQEAEPVDDSHVYKARKALQRYLTRSNIHIDDFVHGLEDQPIRRNPFFDFAKKYFAKMSRNEFGSLVRQVALELQEAGVAKTRSLLQENRSPKSIIRLNPTRSSPTSRKSSPVMLEKDEDQDREGKNDQDYITGPLTEAEQAIIHDAVRSYRSDHDLSHGEFCNIVWDLPRPLEKAEKRRFNAEFLYLLPNRKLRNVREWFKRAFIPYDRSPFTAEDDDAILRLHAQYGADWRRIAASMGRYREDVRDRYRNILVAGKVNSGEWSAQESSQLEDILEQYNDRSELNWGVISKLMGTRSRIQCRDRYMRIKGEKTSSITALRRRLLGSDGERTAAAGSNEPRTHISKFKAGDILCLAKLMKANQVTSIEEAVDRELFFKNKYNEMYTDDEIHIKMQSELAKTGRGWFVTRLDRLIEKYEALDASELIPSIVED